MCEIERNIKYMSNSKPLAVRFAPSPTGPLHIGNARTALYDHFLVKKLGGRCILRIEDTDQNRFKEGSEEYIIEALSWLGVEFTEGPHIGGDYGPYRQSERVAQGLYKQYAQQLLDSGHAYIAFDTPEELEQMREELKEEGHKTFQYNYISRLRMKNSLTLSEEEVKTRLDAGEPYVIRMKMPRKEEIRFYDLVREWVVFHSSQLDDKVLVKSDGYPTYHLANVVDDYLMEISHVIRGEEWLSSTPLHILLYRAFGWEDHIPQWVHLNLILNPNGKGKLSKRQGDKMGFSVFPINWENKETNEIVKGYREEGFLPQAMMNFMALLGWNPGNDEELMSEERIVDLFSLERFTNAGGKFDIDKLKWFNQSYIRSTSNAELLPLVKEILGNSDKGNVSDEHILGVIELMKERVTVIPDFVHGATYFFEAPASYDDKTRRKKWTNQSKEIIGHLLKRFDDLESWKSEDIKAAFEKLINEHEIGMGRLLAPLRLALTGVGSGPGVFEIAELLGKEETTQRIRTAIEKLVAEK